MSERGVSASPRIRSPRSIARTRKRHVLILLLGVVLAYASAIPGDFIWTDRGDLLGGGHRLASIDDLAAAASMTREEYRHRLDGIVDQDARGTWQPVTLLSNSLSWLAWGECAWCFHVENIAWHALVVIGLYALGRHLLVQRRRGNSTAFWAALLFAAHPAATGSVTWAGGRPVLLAAAFAVWALVVLTRLQATSKSRRRQVNRWLLLAPGLGLLAYGSHESSYLLPFAALLVAAFEAGERNRSVLRGIASTRLFALGGLLLALLLVLGWRYVFVAPPVFAGAYPGDGPAGAVGTIVRHFWGLLEQVIIPSEPVVSDAWPITQGWGASEVAGVIGLLLLLPATALLLFWQHPAGLGLAWFLLWILPGSGLFPVERFHSDQALYLASWGLLFALAHAVIVLWRPLGRQLVKGSEALVFAPLLLVLLVVSAFSNARWWDERALFESELNSDPHYMEGRLVLAGLALREDRPADAMSHLLTAIEAQADRTHTGYWQQTHAHALLAEAQIGLALYEEALGNAQAALQARPQSARLQHLHCRAAAGLGRLEEARRACLAAGRANPQIPGVKADIAVIDVAAGNLAAAREPLAQALEKGLGTFERQRAMALVHIGDGDWEAAATRLEAALKMREDPSARARLAWVEWQAGRRDVARAHLATALENGGQNRDYVNRVVEIIRGDFPAGPGAKH